MGCRIGGMWSRTRTRLENVRYAAGTTTITEYGGTDYHHFESYQYSLFWDAAREFCVRYGNDVVHACTDVTGFGLIGHLLEMLLANETDTRPKTLTLLQPMESICVVLDIQDIHAIPFYRGGLEASSQHVYSSLQKQNTRNRRAILNDVQAAATFRVEFPLLFDPQTAGGLLFFIDPSYCDACLLHLTTVGRTKFTSVIGEVLSYSVDREIPSKLQHL
jgi:selenide, water dikinase